MEERIDPIQQIYRILIGVITAGCFWLVWPYISSVVVLVIFAFLLTTILLPGVDRLERKIKSRGLSVMILILTVITVIVLFIGGFASGLLKQTSEFTHQINSESFQTNLDHLVTRINNIMPDFVLGTDPNGNGDKNELVTKILGLLSNVLQNVLSLAGAVGGFVFNSVMVLIFTVILLFEYHNFKKSLVHFISNKYFEIGLRLVYNVERSVSRYLRGQLLAASSVALMSTIGLLILNGFGANLTMVVFIGIIAGLANLIPLIGPFVGMVPAILIAVMNNMGSEVALAHELFGVIPSPFFVVDIIFMFILVQQVDNNFVTPMLVGESVGIHPMLVMIALLIGGTLVGPIGMLFAVPAAGILKVVGQEISFVSKNAHLL